MPRVYCDVRAIAEEEERESLLDGKQETIIRGKRDFKVHSIKSIIVFIKNLAF